MAHFQTAANAGGAKRVLSTDGKPLLIGLAVRNAIDVARAGAVGLLLTLVSDGEKADPGLSIATREAVTSALTRCGPT